MTAVDSPPLGKLLRQWRRAASLTQEELAELAGMSVETVSALERGISRSPYRATVTSLADALALDQKDRARFLAAARPERGAPVTAAAGGRPESVPTSPSRPLPAIGSLAQAVTELQHSPLLGRTHDLEVVRRLLLGGATRLVTLVGPAGVGKTSLALEVSCEVGSYFADGVIFVDLTTVRDPAKVLLVIGESLGFRDLESQLLRGRLQAYLAERELLLLLDNVEHVLAPVQELAEVLTAAPRLTLLATGRESLHLWSEQIFHVPPLALPDLDTLLPLEGLAQVPSVALFLRRAQAINPEFALDEDNARAVAELVVRLDGLPLTIELAAARTSLLTPQMILERLGQRLSLLRWQAQDLPERQKTLRSAIAWSYDLLSPEVQILFRHLGVFAGSFSLDAAEAIAEPLELDAIEGLASLVDKSLVQAQGRDQDTVRYVLLESIREYAREQLAENGELETVGRTHAQYYVGLAEQADSRLRGREQMAWYARLEAEMANLRVALRWLLDHGDSEQALRLAGALGYFWWVRGYHSEGWRWLDEAVARAPEADPALRVTALGRAGTLLMYGGDLERSKVVLEEALALARQHGLTSAIPRPLAHLGLRAALAGNLSESLQLLQAARDRAQQLQDAHQVSFTLAALGYRAFVEGDDQQAADLYQAAIARFRAWGDEASSTVVQYSLAVALHRLGKLDEAAQMLRDGLRTTLAHHNRWQLCHALEATLVLVGDRTDAERRARLVGALDTLIQTTGATYGTLARVVSQDTVHERNQAEQERLAMAWRAGRSLPFGEVVRLALAVLDDVAGSLDVREIPASEAAQRSRLSPREQDVLRLVAEGLTNKEIARRLIVTDHTVKSHLTSLFNKLGVDTRAQAVAIAAQRDLL